jgi:hypothetical protein
MPETDAGIKNGYCEDLSYYYWTRFGSSLTPFLAVMVSKENQKIKKKV